MYKLYYMSDCLRKNISVQQPVYCQDTSGNILPDTAMYEWMSIRSAGPNTLQDNHFCGENEFSGNVQIDGDLTVDGTINGNICLNYKPLGINPIMDCFLEDVVDNSGVISAMQPPTVAIAALSPYSDLPNLATGYQTGVFYPCGLYNYQNYPAQPEIIPWSLVIQFNPDVSPTGQTLTCLQQNCPGIVTPFLSHVNSTFEARQVNLSNTSGVKIAAAMQISGTCNISGAPNTAGFEWQVAIGKITAGSPQVEYEDILQGSLCTFGVGGTGTGGALPINSEFLAELEPGDIVVPVFRWLTDITELNEDNTINFNEIHITINMVGACDGIQTNRIPALSPI